MSESDHEYFCRRAAEERDALKRAESPEVAAVHRALAERYELLARRYGNSADGDNGLQSETRKLQVINLSRPIAEH